MDEPHPKPPGLRQPRRIRFGNGPLGAGQGEPQIATLVITTLVLIGTVTVLMVISVGFLGFNNAPRTVVTSGPVPPVDSIEFAQALSRLVGSPIERGGSVEVLNNGDEFLPALLESINRARHSINFSVKHALEEKARAGVDVRLLLPGPDIDNRSLRFSGQNHYHELLSAGVRIFEYQPTFIHAKYVVIDGRWSIVGSPNINSRSRYLDEENAFGLLDFDLGARLDRVFTADLAHAKEIKLDAWRRRNPLGRILELSSRILDQQS